MPKRSFHLKPSYQWWIGSVVIALLTVATVGLFAGSAPSPDRAQALEDRLRCPTCKNVAIADSFSETAAGMRRIIAEQVAEGRSDEQIITYFIERYGDWVLLDPPVEGQTLLLWLLPIAAAGAGAVVLTRARRSANDPPPLPEAERSRVNAALNEYRSRAKDDDEP